MTYEYKPQGNPLKFQDLSGFTKAVTEIHFQIRKVEGDTEGPWSPFSYALPAPSAPFVDFDSLTQQQALGWRDADAIAEHETMADRAFDAEQARLTSNAGSGAPSGWG